MRKHLGSVIGLVLLAIALFGLYRMIRHHRLSDIMANLGAIPLENLLLALLFTLLSYTVLTFYDLLALKYLGHPQPYHRIVKASFVSYALAHTMGVTVLSGTSVRYRFYSEWGLTATQIAKVVLFNTFTAIFGLITLGGAALLLFPIDLPRNMHFLERGPQLIGLVFLLFSCVYLFMSARHKGHLRLGKRVFYPPTLNVALLQIVIACADLIFAASVLYFLLPPGVHVPYMLLVGIYVLTYLLGLVSQVPGGIGVFDTGMLFLLSAFAEPPAILGSLLAFRLVYYVLPLCIAIGWLGAHEAFKGSNVKN